MDKSRAQRLATELFDKFVGGWKIIALIDNGASAAVFKAEKDGIVAALKIIDPELEDKYGPENQEGRINLEKNLIGKAHSNLVCIFDGGRCTVTNYLYIAMEFLPGRNLNDYVGKVPKDRVRSIISQVASAAKFLEELDLCHRDIKPANIHITEDFSKATLMDLGILRHISGSGHGTGDQFIGSTKYCPLEFIYGEEQKNTQGWRAITFYQLGAVLYDLLMGRIIFNEVNNYAKTLEAIKFSQPIIECDECHPSLVTLARSCLNKSAANRLQLVKWEDFLQEPSILESDIEAIKVEIQKRQSNFLVHTNQQSVSKTALKRTLDSIVRSLEDLVREICSQSDLFPPVRIENSSGVAASTKYLLVTVHPSPKHVINNPLYLEFEINLIDAAQSAVALNFRASLGQYIGSSAEHWQSMYRGPYSKADIEKTLDAILYKCLYAATDKIDKI